MTRHVVSPRTYFAIFLALLVLLLLTVAAAEINHGPLNLAVALTIATVKALLIVLFFMHLRYSSGQARLFAIAGVLWLGILISLMMNDYLTRGWGSSLTGNG